MAPSVLPGFGTPALAPFIDDPVVTPFVDGRAIGAVADEPAAAPPVDEPDELLCANATVLDRANAVAIASEESLMTYLSFSNER
jgi:hypothetical protein